jgi:hypothetical protein
MHLRFHTLVRREATTETKGRKDVDVECKHIAVDDGGMEQGTGGVGEDTITPFPWQNLSP